MEVLEYPIKRVPKSGVVTLALFGCTHFGHAGIAIEKLKHEVDYVSEDPWARWLFLGDSGEYIVSNDKRWEIGALDPEYHTDDYVDRQVDRCSEAFQPIRNQAIGFIMGNHEDSYLKFTKSNPAKRIAKSLDTNFLGYTALIRLRIQTRTGPDWCPVIFAMHGKTGATTLQGQMNYLKRISTPFGVDVAVMAHVHRCAADNNDVQLVINDEGTDVQSLRRHYAITGTFMRTYFVRGDGSAGYGEKAHYPPSALGCSSVEFHVGERMIRAKDYLS
jgi:hypothetical protein